MTKDEATSGLLAIHDVRKLRSIARLRTGYRELTNELMIGTYIGRELLRDKCSISMGTVVRFFSLVEALERDSDPAETKPEPVKPGAVPDSLSPRVSTALGNVLTALTAVSDCVVAEFASVRSEEYIRLESLLAAQKTEYERRLFLAAKVNVDLDKAAVVVVGESEDSASSADASEDSAATAAAERDRALDQVKSVLADHAITVAKLKASEELAATVTRLSSSWRPGGRTGQRTRSGRRAARRTLRVPPTGERLPPLRPAGRAPLTTAR
jgi:hypothetical protein